jgi:hypothetical protein
VVYWHDGGIYYRTLTGPAARRVYQPARPARSPSVRAGYLPSPDGQWLLVWETPAKEDGTYGDRTWWRLVSVPRGEVTDIDQTPGPPWLLPYWQDARHLLFQGEVALNDAAASSAVYDLDSRQLSRPLSALREATPQYSRSIRDWLDRTRLTLYAQQHYLSELAALGRTLWAVPGEATRLSAYLWDLPHADPPEYLLLRNLGLPLGTEMSLARGGYSDAFAPRVAPAPDGTTAAVSVIREGAAPGGPGVREGYGPLGACLDVLFLGSEGQFGTARQLRTVRWSRDDVPLGKLALPPPVPTHGIFQAAFADLRWSADGRYLVYGLYAAGASTVSVVDAQSWKEVLTIEHASSAFPMPAAGITDK